MIRYGGVDFAVPVLQGEGQIIDPRWGRFSTTNRSLVRGDLWDIGNFERRREPPQVIGSMLPYSFDFSMAGCPRVLDMPIKFPGSNVRLPWELIQMEPLVEMVVAHEQYANPRYNNLYCYLTIDQSFTTPDTTQRKGGKHVDGFQGVRIVDPLPIDHSYIVSDKYDETTRFLDQPVRVGHLDRAIDNFFLDFDRQLEGAEGYQHEAYEVVLFDAYAIHEAAVAVRPGRRTFARLSWTVREFDRLGNTHNPMFDYAWDMVARDVHSVLKVPA